MSLQKKIQDLEDKLAQMAKQGVEIPAELAEHLDVFERVADQMLEMVDEALAVAPLEPEIESPQVIQQVKKPQPIAPVSPKAYEPYTDESLDQPAEISVLLVEDNIVNRKLAVLILEKVGCMVDVAFNGAEGVEKFKSGNYAAIFMDCQMPVMDGYDATRSIRDLETDGSRIPIIAVTANAMKGDREKCIECGMDDYISKPIMPTDLHEAVSRWCKVTA